MCARQKTTQRCREWLADERICINAQDCYKKTKWKAKTVRPSGTTASVSSTGTPVTLSPEGGASLSALSEGEEFWVEETGETGGGEIDRSVFQR